MTWASVSSVIISFITSFITSFIISFISHHQLHHQFHHQLHHQFHLAIFNTCLLGSCCYRITVCVSLSSITDNCSVEFSGFLGVYLLSVSRLLMYPSWLHHTTESYSLLQSYFLIPPTNKAKTKTFISTGSLVCCKLLLDHIQYFSFNFFSVKKLLVNPLLLRETHSHQNVRI